MRRETSPHTAAAVEVYFADVDPFAQLAIACPARALPAKSTIRPEHALLRKRALDPNLLDPRQHHSIMTAQRILFFAHDVAFSYLTSDDMSRQTSISRPTAFPRKRVALPKSHLIHSPKNRTNNISADVSNRLTARPYAICGHDGGNHDPRQQS